MTGLAALRKRLKGRLQRGHVVWRVPFTGSRMVPNGTLDGTKRLVGLSHGLRS